MTPDSTLILNSLLNWFLRFMSFQGFVHLMYIRKLLSIIVHTVHLACHLFVSLGMTLCSFLISIVLVSSQTATASAYFATPFKEPIFLFLAFLTHGYTSSLPHIHWVFCLFVFGFLLFLLLIFRKLHGSCTGPLSFVIHKKLQL